jgi:hypothetical protein
VARIFPSHDCSGKSGPMNLSAQEYKSLYFSELGSVVLGGYRLSVVFRLQSRKLHVISTLVLWR